MDKKMKATPIKTDSRPLYSQTIEALTNLIIKGDYKTGDQLPKEDVLAPQLGISRSTLRVALGYLETYGMISRRPGVGTFVSTTLSSSQHEGYLGSLDRMETLDTIAERAGVEARFLSREMEDIVAGEELGRELGVDPQSALHRVQVVEAIDEAPAAYFDTYVVSGKIEKELLLDRQIDLISYLSEYSEQTPTHTRSEIWAKNSDPFIAEKLGIKTGDAVLYIEENFHAKDGCCVAFSRNYFVTEVFRFYLIRRVVLGN
jgi:GntR family transcriptional regulator